MDRRNFLKQASGYTLAAIGMMTGIGQAFAGTSSVGESAADASSNNRVQRKEMEHRKLGGMEVSAIGLGCLPMVGYYGGKYEKKEMIDLIRRAYDQGVTLFDTAEVYGPYTSEEWVGEAVAPFRDKIKIETKFGFGVEESQPTALNSRPISGGQWKVPCAVCIQITSTYFISIVWTRMCRWKRWLGW